MWSRLFGQRAPALAVPWDVHAHWLPGVDDGAPDPDESIRMLQVLAEAGCRGAVATPHVYPGLFENDEAELRRVFEAFRGHAEAAVPGMALQLGAEYMFCERLLGRILGDDPALLRFGPKEDFLLVELPVRGEPAALGEALDHCRRRKRRMILAHVERYAYAAGEAGLDRLASWRSRGALLQLNASSCAGAYGGAIEASARRIWCEGLVDLVGSDIHRAEPGGRVHTKGLAWLGAHAHPDFDGNRAMDG